jgi:four helix bundle protein
MAKVTRFEELDCWKEARLLVKTIYLECEKGPLSNDFDVRSQLRRASLSIMNNIAEGFARKSDKEFIRFLGIAASSASEVKSIIYVLEDIKYIDSEFAIELQEKIDKVRSLTLGLLRYVKSKS